ncbi:MAG: hypothetical protein LBK99_12380 [Opitutaceae bacterium]|jgi:uncharacterized membrane protein|nr:hypothetical protein [Opitutaceae bacterium]
MKKQTQIQLQPKQTRAGARPSVRALLRGLLVPGAFAAAVFSESAASSIQVIGGDFSNIVSIARRPNNDSGQWVYTRLSENGNGTEATLWVPGTDEIGLGTLDGQSTSMALGITSDGQVFGNAGNQAFVWKPDIPNGTSSTAGMTALGTLRPDNTGNSQVFAMNDNGQAVGAAISDFSITEAFVWTEAGGMRQIVTG